jgi:hypothetical protein
MAEYQKVMELNFLKHVKNKGVVVEAPIGGVGTPIFIGK